MQVDDRTAAVEVPNSHEVVSSQKFFFVLDTGTWSEDVKTSQYNRTTGVKVPNFIQIDRSKTISI